MSGIQPATAGAEIVVHLFDELGDTPRPELADIWPRLRALLAHWREFNQSEAAIRSQQHGIIRDGCFLMPSPFADTADVCTSSYFLRHRFCYLFTGEEKYFWITAQVDRGYALATIYFPHRRVAVALYSFSIEPSMLGELDGMRAAIAKPENGLPVVVTGYPQYMHVLWNELSALEHAARDDLASRMEVAVLFEPFGPMTELYPEFAARTKCVRYDAVTALNQDHRLLIGLGGWTILEATQRRVRRLARWLVAPELIAACDRFRAQFDPVFWLSVKPLPRTCLDQAAVLARLIGGIRQEHPRAGFVLDGTSAPWDAKTNPNYGQGFSEWLETATRAIGEIVDGVFGQLAENLRQAVEIVSGVSVCEEIVWGEAADFYICHGGTMQNKIGWMHRIPGLVHSNAKFLYFFKLMDPPVESGPACFFLSEGLIADAPAENYSWMELQRKDQDYGFTDLDSVLREVLEAFDASRQVPSPC